MSKIIKCMFFVLLAAVLPLSVHAKQVTLHLQDVTVRKAFRELEVKGNVSLVYEKNDVDLTRKVTVKVDNQPISKALDQILKGQELIYKIRSRNLLLKFMLLSNYLCALQLLLLHLCRLQHDHR